MQGPVLHMSGETEALPPGMPPAEGEGQLLMRGETFPKDRRGAHRATAGGLLSWNFIGGISVRPHHTRSTGAAELAQGRWGRWTLHCTL